MPGYTLMARDLHDVPRAERSAGRPPPGVVLGPLTASYDVMAALERACYAPGHVDHEQAAELLAGGSYWRLLNGELIGPVLAGASGQAEDEEGAVLGAIVVVHWSGDGGRWRGGPWVADVLVSPEHRRRGIAAALLRRAMAACAASGAPRVGLSVTTGNPARALYDRLGFVPL